MADWEKPPVSEWVKRERIFVPDTLLPAIRELAVIQNVAQNRDKARSPKNFLNIVKNLYQLLSISPVKKQFHLRHFKIKRSLSVKGSMEM